MKVNLRIVLNHLTAIHWCGCRLGPVAQPYWEDTAAPLVLALFGVRGVDRGSEVTLGSKGKGRRPPGATSKLASCSFSQV